MADMTGLLKWMSNVIARFNRVCLELRWQIITGLYVILIRY